MPLFIVGVVGLSFLLLLVAFHSPLISLKAGMMNLLSVTAAYGVMTLFAKGGGLSNLIGIEPALESVDVLMRHRLLPQPGGFEEGV
jgi:RND superfamily putative drug exporter